MAAVTVSGYNIIRAETMEGTFTVSDIGAGAAGAAETVTYLQGARSVSRKVTNTAIRGTGVTTPAAYTNPDAWLAKVYLSDYQDLNANGLILRVQDPVNAYNQWLLADNGTYGDRFYPITGGWLITLVGLAEKGLVDVTTDTDTYSPYVPYESIPGGGNGGAEDFQVGCGLATGVAKSENIFMDAVDIVSVNGGLRLTGGTGADAPGTFIDFVDFDEGTIGNRYGVVNTKEDILFVNAALWIGDAILDVEFEDSNQVLIWPGGITGAGSWNSTTETTATAGKYNQLRIAPTANSNIAISNSTFIGKGHAPTRLALNARNTGTSPGGDVSPTTANGIITASGLNFNTGDPVIYSGLGDSPSISLTPQIIFARRISEIAFTLHALRTQAYAGTSPLTASPVSSTEPHVFWSIQDNRPQLVIANNSGSVSFNSCTFNNFGKATLRSNTTLEGCNFINCDELTAETDNAASIDNCIFNSETLFPSRCQISIKDPSVISDCTFTGGSEGGGVEITASGTYTFTGNIFSNYGPDGFSFDPQAIDTTADTITISGHNFNTGDPVFYERAGDSGNPFGAGVTDGTLFYTIKVDNNTIALAHSLRGSLLGTNYRHINTFQSGTLQYLYSANAAIYNTSGGHVTLNVVGGSSLSVYNKGLSTTTVNISVPIEITNLTEGSYGIMIGSGGTEDGVILLEGYADSTGTITGSFSGTTPQAVSVRARNGGIILAALQDDGGAFTDYTLAARNRTSPGTGSANDVPLLPASPAVNDAFYVAGLAIFEAVKIDVTTAGTTYVGTWEYWNGSTWSTLTVTDNTNSFQTLGAAKVEFTAPGNWATTTINSKGPYYYIRFRVTTGGGTQPIAENITLYKTTKYLPFDNPGIIQTTTGLSATAVWIEDPNNDS